jgi:RNA polymerase sigma-70 factor (ECF subfamily)
MPGSPGEFTMLLSRARGGDERAVVELIPLVYNELCRLASHLMREERINHTLQPTALVHEAYLRLVGQDQADWQDRKHFMAIAAQQMRRVLVDYARQRKAVKRAAPGGFHPNNCEPGIRRPRVEEILAVDEALVRLSELDPQQERIAELRYFGGLSVEEAAEALGISTRTVKRDWAMAKAWLHAELSGDGLP